MISDTVKNEDVLHDVIVDGVAESRFNIEGWDVVSNTGPEYAHLPDIVAKHSEQIVAIGEVETKGNLNAERALLWKSFGQSCSRFYLFVPEGAEKTAVDLINEHKVECAGLRCYSLNGHLDIRPVYFDEPLCRDDEHPWWLSIGSEESCS